MTGTVSVKAQSSEKQASVAIIGLGVFGHSLASALKERGCEVLAIDHDAATVQRYESQFPVVLGDVTDETLFFELNIASFATAVIALGSNFEASVIASVVLKRVGVRQIVCQSASSKQADILLRLGVDRVIRPDHLVGRRLAVELTTPDMLEQITLSSDYVVDHLKIPEAKANVRLSDVGPARWQVTVLAIQRGETPIVSPASETVLLQGDMLVLLGSNENIIALKNAFCS